MKKHSSVIWTIPISNLRKITKKATTISSILRKCRLKNKGGNHKTLKRRLIEEGIDFSHIPLGRGANKGLHSVGGPKLPFSKILIKNSSYRNRGTIKKRLLDAKRIKNECKICGIGPIWNNKKLSLQLDHINGVSNDYRRRNLRLLCPNCHSQTRYFCGKSGKSSNGKT